jgi:hypothetical protein
MRYAAELSITTVPARTAGGTKRREVALPAENSAISVPMSACSVSSSTGSESPPYASLRPAERDEANSRSWRSGKRRCCRQAISSVPTAPLAPTMATEG